MAEAPKATSLTLPRNAVSVTLIIFCATRVKTMGYEIFNMFFVEFTIVILFSEQTIILVKLFAKVLHFLFKASKSLR